MLIEKSSIVTGILTFCVAVVLAPAGLAGSRTATSPRGPSRQGQSLPSAPANPRSDVYLIQPNEESALAVQQWLVLGGPCPAGQWGLSVASGSQLAEKLRSGLIVVSKQRPDAPDGFLRRIVFINKRAIPNRIIFCTVQAGLGEAVWNGGNEKSKPIHFGFADIASAQGLLPGVSIRPPEETNKLSGLHMAPSDPPGASNDPPSFPPPCRSASRGFQVEMREAPIRAGASLTAAFRLCPQLTVGLIYHFGSLRYLHLGLSVDELAKVDLKAEALGQWQGRQKLAAIRFRPEVIEVGTVPVVVRPVVTIFLSEEGSLRSKLETDATQHAWGYADVAYHNGKWSHSFSRNSEPPEFEQPTISLGSSAKGELGARIELEIYGILGPYFEPAGYVQADYSVQSAQPVQRGCSLKFGLEGSAGIDLIVLEHVVKTKNFGNLFDISQNELCQKGKPAGSL